MECDRSSSTTTALATSPASATTIIGTPGIVGRVAEPLERLVEDERGDAEQQHRVGDGGEHLGAVPAVGARRRRAAVAGEQHRGQAHEHRDQVGEHVAGVGQQRDRVDQQRGRQLEGEEGGQDRRGDEHPADTGVGIAVIVSGTHVCNLCVKTHMSQGRRQNQADQNRVSCMPATTRPRGTPESSKNQNTTPKNQRLT